MDGAKFGAIFSQTHLVTQFESDGVIEYNFKTQTCTYPSRSNTM
jgi:hypothetical protein